MTIEHHPPEELLVALAAGRLGAGKALCLQVHAEGCAACRSQLATLDDVGGALLVDGAEVALAPDALARAWERIERPHPVAPPPAVRGVPLPMPPGVPWPRALRPCTTTRWRWMAPGMRWARAVLPDDPAARLFLLRIAPGTSLARHTHGRVEFTQVLCGAFDDGRAVFGPGDFDLADTDVHHAPRVLPGAECVCLAYVEDSLRYDGRLAGMLGRWIGL